MASASINGVTAIWTRGAFLLAVVAVFSCWRSSYALRTFEFDIHHRFSDPVKRILEIDGGDWLPVKGTAAYYAAMAQRDRIFHGRRLAAADHAPLTFADGNTTYRLNLFGFLHYANVTVGTPGLSFLVALDTGSDLFWIPCDCTSCVRGIRYKNEEIDFNIYSLNTSSTGKPVSCNSSLCADNNKCSAAASVCPYRVRYLSANTSSAGFLIEDMLHLTKDDDPSKLLNAKIPFGCGKTQTGSFLNGAAPNGLLGLGIDNISVPSMLARQNLSADSFSMCFGDDGTGRISFGDTGSSDQGQTPLNLRQVNPTYNVSVTRIIVGANASDADVYAIFDTGTSFTYLNDPFYTLITKKFNSQAKDDRHTANSDVPFEFCYDVSSNQPNTPPINLTMKGGDQFYVTNPIVLVPLQDGDVYCLGIVRSDNVNIIGQNFMTGYRVVFDREKMVLGWKSSNCSEAVDSNTLPLTPGSSTGLPPISSIQPQATSQSGSRTSGSPPTLTKRSFILHSYLACTLIIFFLF